MTGPSPSKLLTPSLILISSKSTKISSSFPSALNPNLKVHPSKKNNKLLCPKSKQSAESRKSKTLLWLSPTIFDCPQGWTCPNWWIISWMKLITCSYKDIHIDSCSTVTPFSPANSYRKLLWRWNKKQAKTLSCQKTRHGWCPTLKKATLNCCSTKISTNLQSCFITTGKIEGKKSSSPSYDCFGGQTPRNLTTYTHSSQGRKKNGTCAGTTDYLKTK